MILHPREIVTTQLCDPIPVFIITRTICFLINSIQKYNFTPVNSSESRDNFVWNRPQKVHKVKFTAIVEMISVDFVKCLRNEMIRISVKYYWYTINKQWRAFSGGGLLYWRLGIWFPLFSNLRFLKWTIFFHIPSPGFKGQK